MAWYEIKEGKDTIHIRASNTRTAFDKGFKQLCGRKFNLQPGMQMNIQCTRLRGGSELAHMLEDAYIKTKKGK